MLGRQISYSFSPTYFREKFAQLGLADYRYALYDQPDVADLRALFLADPALAGLNVTIPYKQAVMPLLDELDPVAGAVGAVNVIKRLADGSLRGYNTDAPAFRDTLRAWYGGPLEQALILGAGGAARAVRWALHELGMTAVIASRSAGDLTYDQLAAEPHTLQAFALIINTTPVGTFPAIEELPPVPVAQLALLSPANWVYDLIYNPPQTRLLREAAARGAHTYNGVPMLHRQAELAWSIWNA